MVENTISFGILTVSDRCSAGSAEDKSGPNLGRLVKEGLVPSAKVVQQTCVPDDEQQIMKMLLQWSDTENLDVILTTGGTGFAPRDVTPEATLKVIQRQAPGLTYAMFKSSLDITPYAMLSRAVSGIRGSSIIVNLPGSSKGSQECFEAVAMSIPHAVALARNRQSAHAEHKSMKVPQAPFPRRDGSPRHCSHRHCSSGHHEQRANVPAQPHSHHGDCVSKVDPSFVARRQRESPFPMISVEEAQQLVLRSGRLLGLEPVPVHLALGRVLGQNVAASDPLPPFPASLKDGYAAVASDGAGKRTVISASNAGQKPSEMLRLRPGEVMRINTGAPVPQGADCVVQVEDTRLEAEADGGRRELEIEVLKAPSVGLDIRPVGSDIALGQVVVGEGAVLGPAELGMLAAVGATEVPVYRRPTVALLSTGDELQDPKKPLAPGRIRDTNKTTLLALLAQHGFDAIDLGIALDNPQSMLSKLKEGLQAADVVVSTGSVSMGDRDLLKQILTLDLGANILFGRLNMKPGKPTTFATIAQEERTKCVLGLPGNPVSAVVTSHLFLLPLLRQMTGHPHPLPPLVRATIDRDVSLDPRPEYHRAVLLWSPDSDVPVAQSTGNQISSRLLNTVGANALLVLPGLTGSCKMVKAGTTVNAMLLSH